jgi:hypothetical protein
MIYRLMRRGISRNLFAYAVPTHRLVNLDDDAAVKIDRDFGLTVAAVLVFTTVARYLTIIAQPEIAGGLTPDNIRLLLLSCGAVMISRLLSSPYAIGSRGSVCSRPR